MDIVWLPGYKIRMVLDYNAQQVFGNESEKKYKILLPILQIKRGDAVDIRLVITYVFMVYTTHNFFHIFTNFIFCNFWAGFCDAYYFFK